MQNSKNLRDKTFRQIGDHKQATILARNSDGSYQYETLRTKQIGTATPANPSEDFAPGARVVIGPLAASNETKGSGNVIITRNPREQRGVALIPSGAANQYASVFITSVLPRPLRVPIGFDTPRELVINGFNLTDAPTYEVAGITDDTAPVITGTSITCELLADDTVVPGLYDVSVHGKTFADQLEVYEVGEEVFVAGYLYQDLGGGNDVDYPCVIVFRASDWTQTRVLMGTSAIGVYPDCTSGIVRVDEMVHCLVTDTGSTQARIFTVTADPDDRTSRDSGNIAATVIDYQSAIAWNGSKLVIVSHGASKFLYTIDFNGANKVTVATLATDYRGVLWDGTYYWVCDVTNGVARVTTGGTVLAVAGATGFAMAHSGGFVYALSGADLKKITASTATVAATLALGVGGYGAMAVVGGFLYVSVNGAIKKIDLGSFTVAATLTIASADIRTISASRDGLSLWCLDFQGDGEVHRVELAGFTLAETHNVNLFGGNFYANAVEVY